MWSIKVHCLLSLRMQGETQKRQRLVCREAKGHWAELTEPYGRALVLGGLHFLLTFWSLSWTQTLFALGTLFFQRFTTETFLNIRLLQQCQILFSSPLHVFIHKTYSCSGYKPPSQCSWSVILSLDALKLDE